MISAFERITSIKDPRVVEARSLARSRVRRDIDKCLLYGEQQIRWAREAGIEIEAYFFDVSSSPPEMSLTSPMLAVTGGILQKITGTSYLISPLGVAHVRTEDIGSLSADFILLLDDVRDQGNLGTIIRTARAFGVHDVVISGQDSQLFHRKTIDASRGTVFDTRAAYSQTGLEAVQQLKAAGYQIVATSPHAQGIQSLSTLEPQPVVLVVGNESRGISPELEEEADLLIRIPMAGPVESLNVGVATGISVYELRIKLVLAMLTDYIRKTLGREVNVTAKLIQMAVDQRLREVTNFNSTQVILMMVMACDGVMPREQVEKDTAAHGTELDALLEPVLSGGHVLNDEQLGGYTLTDSGRTLISQLWPVLEATEEEILTGLDPAEREQLVQLIKHIQGNCLTIIGGSTEG